MNCLSSELSSEAKYAAEASLITKAEDISRGMQTDHWRTTAPAIYDDDYHNEYNNGESLELLIIVLWFCPR
ncbi:hypothetical protein SADUNF_Sadunf04G0016000 [Salix dunnii]|uniref:Uncharacterized protein n=1 Tax=Salix dunnii TaxID=1413687 RepID=A0A835KCK2_9ROSI|nr:hypothetical protein SADUNF_Sadunf04G0016000 [Salix dunnii]